MTRSLMVFCAFLTCVACVPEEDAEAVGTTQAELRAFAGEFVVRDIRSVEPDPEVQVGWLDDLYVCYCKDEIASYVCTNSVKKAEVACERKHGFDCAQVTVADSGEDCDPIPGDPDYARADFSEVALTLE